MAREQTFRQRVFITLVVVAIVPAALALGVTTLALSEVLSGIGASGPWVSVGASGGELLQRLEPYAATDTALARVAAEHQTTLGESVRFSRIYEVLAQRFLRLLPVLMLALATLVVVLSTAAARRLARAMSRPIISLAGWAEMVGDDQPLPPSSQDPPNEVLEVRRLRSSLRSMADDLAAARRREIEAARLRSWSTMARRVAHELKNPLTPMKFAATTISRVEDPELQESGRVLLEEIDRLDDMARSFSQLGKLPAGPPSEVDLVELLGTLARLHGTDTIQVEVVAAGDPDAPTVIRGHYDALQQAFRNLLANGMESMEDAGVEGRILVAVSRRDDEIVILIDDEGPGMTPEVQERLWEPEFTTKRRGTGIGLTLVRRTVAAHGGEVTAQTAPGGGARFQVLLPAGD